MKTSKYLIASLIIAGGFVSSYAKTAQEVVDSIGKVYAPDARQAVYQVKAVTSPDNKKVTVYGSMSDRATHEQLFKTLAEEGYNAQDYTTVMPDTEWATPRISVACLRTGPKHAAEMASQAIMGQPLRVLEKGDSWYRVQTPDGYIAWVTDSSIVPMTNDEMKKWRSAPRVVVTNPYQTRVWANPKTTSVREVVSDVVLGNILEGKYDKSKRRIEVKLPDGRTGWINTADVAPIEEWAAQNFNPEKILDVAYSMEGTPYLWGGTSVKSLDCSGLAKVSYLANGIILMRDASQQALTGTRIEAKDWPTCQAGDLLFFGNAKTGKVTHVAIYDHDGNYVHSSGRVKRNSVDPKSDSYLTTPFLHAVRIAGNEGTPGITYARNHPWYFNK
ncbi:MAG: C40 family peptidase [Muribaculaceae bacterium]|nr:C40 family peptidase [Muribaculaceae bacterium]